MPRFLEIDYFHLHQHRRNLLFQSCLLNEPRHITLLSVTSSKYDHLGYIFRSLESAEKSISEGEIEIQGDFDSLCKSSKENYNCLLPEILKKQVCLKDFPSSFIIPSSNPDSPLPEHPCNLNFNDAKNMLEDDLEDDDTTLQVKETGSQDMLEEIESSLKLDDLKNIPSSSATLSKKLKPVRVTDPFLTRFEQQLSIINCEREFFQICYEGRIELLEEELDDLLIPLKNDLDDGYLLEETINFHSSTNSDLTDKIELLPAICSGLSKSNVTLEDDYIERMKALSSGIISSVNMTEDLFYPKKDSNTTDDLQVLCGNGGYGNQWETANLVLESPVHCSIFSTDSNALASLRTSTELLSNEISPLNGRHFLSTQSKKEMEMMLRDRDKTLGETLSMTLKVPETYGLRHTSLVPFIREQCSLYRENMNYGLEVSLPWDPFSLPRHEVIESKSTLQSELRLCSKHTVSDDIPDDDLKIIKIEDSADCSRDVLACELAVEKTCSDFSIKEMNKATSRNYYHAKANTKATSSLSMSQRLNKIQNLVIEDVHQRGKSSKISLHELGDREKGKALKYTNTIESPLDSFILLRTGKIPHSEPSNTSLPVAMVPPRSMVKAAKVKPLSLHIEQSSSMRGKGKPQSANGAEGEKPNSSPAKPEKQEGFVGIDNSTKSRRSASSKMKREVISVEMSAVYQVIIDRLEKDSRPLLKFLKERKVISQDHQFCNMKPDLTRFLIRQQEKRHENSTINAYEEDIMKGVICLHALVLSSDAVINYGILAAVGIIEIIKEKYDEFVGDLLNSVRQYLLEEQRKAGAESQLHPKIQMTVKMVNQSLCVPETKVLILIRRYFDYCFETLKEALSSLERAVILRYPRGTVDQRRVLDLISKGNIIIAALSSELQFCPWHRFSCVFEFEHKDESEWYQLCFEENASLNGFYALNSVPRIRNRDEGRDKSMPCKEATPDTSKPMKVFSEHIVIGSRRVTHNQNLLYELENKLNITLIERDYPQLYDMDYKTECCLQPDIAVDERTCIVIVNCQEIAASTNNKMPQDIFSSMKMKCLECYIILTVLELDINGPFLFDVMEPLSQMLLPSLQARNANHETKFHLLYAFSHEETAEWILLICNQARDTSTTWNSKDWCNRFWLTEEMSLHERFLLSFPCFTSFTAQIVLTAAPLRKILGLGLEEMRNAIKWLPDKIIEAFYTSVNEDKFENTSISAPLLDNDSFALNITGQNDFNDTHSTSKYVQERGDYEPYTASADWQQCNSFPYIYQSLDNSHASKFIPYENLEQQKMRYEGHPFACQLNMDQFAKSFIKEDASVGKTDLAYTGEMDSLLTIASNHPEDHCISKHKEYIDMCFHNDQKSLHDNHRQQYQLHPKDPFPKWKLLENNGNDSHWSHNNRAGGVKLQGSQGWLSSLGPQKSVKKGVGTPSTVRLTPSKKRRLTFEKDPNSRNGQTRLSFV